VQYCVIPAGATGCTHSGNLVPAGGATAVDAVQVLVDGATVVVLADVYGAAVGGAGHHAPEQEWQSTDGGATFAIVDGGLSVASGVINSDSEPLGAVIVPGTGVLGYGWNTAGGNPPTFDAFALSSPTECSAAMCLGTYASLEPASDPDQIGNAGGQFASQLGAHPGILGIFDTDFSTGPLGCPHGSFGTAFAYGSGAQSATNSYNASPGTPGSAWQVAVAPGDCDVAYPAVGGGPGGFGVLEAGDAAGNTIYHRFDQATARFDAPVVTVAEETERSPSVSQDGAGGVYATFLGGGEGGPVSLAYSADGGTTWTGPAVLAASADGGAADVSSAVGATGQGWVAWTDNGSVYAQQFSASDAAVAALGSTASAAGTTVTVTVACSALPCTINLALQGSAGHGKTESIGTARVTIRRRGAQRVAIRLNRAGASLLAAHHDRLTATLLLSERLHGGLEHASRVIKIRP
jgi:hypothetical protein